MSERRFECLHDERSLRAWALETALGCEPGSRFSDPDVVIRYVLNEPDPKAVLTLVGGTGRAPDPAA